MHICAECGYQSIKWLGRCPACQAWESFRRQERAVAKLKLKSQPKALLLKEINKDKQERFLTGLEEFDRLIGGGLVLGQVILIGGEPGVGKSTLLLEIASRTANRGKTLYVSAEESPQQIGIRASRLEGIDRDKLYISSEDKAEAICQLIKKDNFKFVVVDSIQVISSLESQGAKGSVLAIRSCADYLTQAAKASGAIIFIVGHVTKTGVIAGPKLLEHVVDSVLYFEGEVLSNYRILRSIKNRFGPTGDIAVFDMTSSGLLEVKEIADIFLPAKKENISGSCVVCPVEGLRPVLVELQSLVSRATFGTVRRRSLGFDFNRFSLLVAIIEKRLKISLASEDIFLNVAGGLRIDDPAVDLGAAVAIISSFFDKQVPADTVFIGEVGLGGELRKVRNINSRLKEISRANFKHCFMPKANQKEANDGLRAKAVGFSSLKEVYDKLFAI